MAQNRENGFDGISGADPMTHTVCHCVMLEIKREMDLKKLQQLITTVRSRVPGLIELHFGKNDMNMYRGKNESPAGNTHALFSRHQNAHYLEVYQKHPDHVALAQYLLGLVERPPTVVDFVNIPSKI